MRERQKKREDRRSLADRRVMPRSRRPCREWAKRRRGEFCTTCERERLMKWWGSGAHSVQTAQTRVCGAAWDFHAEAKTRQYRAATPSQRVLSDAILFFIHRTRFYREHKSSIKYKNEQKSTRFYSFIFLRYNSFILNNFRCCNVDRILRTLKTRI